MFGLAFVLEPGDHFAGPFNAHSVSRHRRSNFYCPGERFDRVLGPIPVGIEPSKFVVVAKDMRIQSDCLLQSHFSIFVSAAGKTSQENSCKSFLKPRDVSQSPVERAEDGPCGIIVRIQRERNVELDFDIPAELNFLF